MGSIIIFGATGGIGKALALQFASENKDLLLSASNLEKLKILQQEIQNQFSCSCPIFQLDFSNVDGSIEQLMVLLKETNISGAVFAQGIMDSQDNYQSDINKIKRMYQVNLFGIMQITNLILSKLPNQNDSFVSFISSVAAMRGRKKNFYYGSSKAALNIFIEGLRHQYGQGQILIQTVLPGMIKTNMTKNLPESRLMALPENAAADIIRGIKKKKTVVFTPWYWKYIMLLVKNIPDFIFKRLNF